MPIDLDKKYKYFIQIEKEPEFQKLTASKKLIHLALFIPNDGLKWKAEVRDQFGALLIESFSDHYDQPKDELKDVIKTELNELIERVFDYEWRFIEENTRFGTAKRFQLYMDETWVDEFYSWWFRAFWKS
ncbi:hypothetical protein JNL27_17335 [bacterium]|nr:hypothetical protein [bacterium]